MCPLNPEIEGLKRFVKDKLRRLPGIESKVISQEQKISFLVKKLSKMSGEDFSSEIPEPIESKEEKITELKRALAENGLEVEGFDDAGFVKLKAVNEAGFFTLRKLNTIFHISTLESYFEQYIK